MDLELLQQCLMVEVDHKQIYPSLVEDGALVYVQYDIGDEHLKIDVPIFALCSNKCFEVIKEKCYQWYMGLK